MLFKLPSKKSTSIPKRCLLLFTRYPELGKTKTRLIPALGPDGAAVLQRDMTHHTLETASCWRDMNHQNSVLVYFAGGDANAMRATFSNEFEYKPQQDGSLGFRMYQAFLDAFKKRSQYVVAIGSDCPDVNPRILVQAFEALRKNDLVLGPVTDGGYYLIGLSRPIPELFSVKIPWGTDQVLTETKSIIDSLKLKTAWLETLQDVDLPEDLPVWKHRRVKKSNNSKTDNPFLSIVIPTLNEDNNILTVLSSINASPQVEVIVVDGGSLDSTVEIATNYGAAGGVKVLTTSPGRAHQMNVGADVARGKYILFLHGDTCLPPDYLNQIKRCVSRNKFVAGAFKLAFDRRSTGLNLIKSGANIRSWWLGLPYGDQAIFIQKDTFSLLGGYNNISIMEDYDLIQRFKKHGRIYLTSASVISSSRRWNKQGLWRTTLLHILLVLGWHLGISPERMNCWR